MVHYCNDVIGCDFLRVKLHVGRNVRRRIPARIESDAAITSCKVTNLHLPTAKVAAKFVNKYDRNATSQIFIVKLGSVALKRKTLA